MNYDKAEKIIKEMESMSEEQRIEYIKKMLSEIDALKRDVKSAENLINNGVKAMEREKLN